MEPIDRAWQSSELANLYLDNIRGAIPLAAEQIEVMLRIANTRSAPVARFLDLGCGDGVLGLALLSRYPYAQGVFVDFSAAMLEACRHRLDERKVEALVLELDYGRTGWDAAVTCRGPFDAIVSGFSIHHQPDPRKRALYREIHALLAPGGWFIHLEHCAPASSIAHRLFEETFIDNIQALMVAEGRDAGDREEIRKRFVDRVDKQANLLAPVETQCAWLREMGYEEVDCYLKIHELAVFAGRRPA